VPACLPAAAPARPPQVGAALSMVYTSGAPIMFVGCGQTYVDLKKLHVKSVVKSLLK
jgi:signal recognition particle receptor subunit alpha